MPPIPTPAEAVPPSGARVLDVEGLTVDFALRGGALRAVDGVSFTLDRGRTLCLVGESGSGKSVTARSILQIVGEPGRIVAGRIVLQVGGERGEGIDVVKLDPFGRAIRAIRGRDVAMIFQEPMSSLSPVHTIGFQIEESLKLHTALDAEARRARVLQLLRRVEIPNPEVTIDRYPFEYSGGMRQRATIAMALACNPKILIADEPTTALDVTTQAEILDLLRELQRELGMAVLFITHDMGVVAEIADDVVVMLGGKAVERGPVDAIFHAAQHPYTRRLIGAAVRLESRAVARPVAAAPGPGERPVLSVRGLRKRYDISRGWFRVEKRHIDAVDDVSFDLAAGETLGIVGESGSGKTTVGRCILRLVEPSSGEIVYRGANGATTDIAKLGRRELAPVNREIRMIFQDPFGSLNPRMTVEQIVAEPLRNNGFDGNGSLRDRVAELLAAVGLEPAHMERYPHAFSGGQRQRVGIARALALDPRVVIADEATSALDVSLRSQILDLLIALQARLNLSFIFISHDIGVIRYFCDRVAVMFEGRMVEIGPTERVCEAPEHAYTKALLSAVPRPDPRRRSMHRRHRYAAEARPNRYPEERRP